MKKLIDEFGEYKKMSWEDKLKEYHLKKDMLTIRKGDTVMLKTKYHKYYRDKFSPKYVDISRPAKVIRVNNSGKIFLEGWEEIHGKKEGKGFPDTSFDKLSERQIRIMGFYKPEPVVVKSIGQIQDFNDKEFTLCIFAEKNIINVYPNELLTDIANIEKGAFITVVSTTIPGKQIIDFTPSTEDEITQYADSFGRS